MQYGDWRCKLFYGMSVLTAVSPSITRACISTLLYIYIKRMSTICIYNIAHLNDIGPSYKF